MIDWEKIDTVMLDMDGTLLDLNFDNHFWQEFVPQRFARQHDISLEESKRRLAPLFQSMEGKLEWYCLDFWSQELDLDIVELKKEIDHLIALHPYVIDFLDAVRRSQRRLVLVTNAHIKSLDLKMQKTQLQGHFDRLICSHDYGLPKEEVQFWDRLQNSEPFNPDKTLLVDDSLPLLRSAKLYGFAHLLSVHQPDTQRPPKDVEEFDAISSFKDIMPSS